MSNNKPRFPTISNDVQEFIVNAYSSEPEIRPSIADLALAFSISPTNVRRILAEAELVEFSSYKTAKQDEMIKILKGHGITTPQQLRNMLYGKTKNQTAA